MEILDKIDTRLGETIVVASLVPPDADAVFLSINSKGALGELNQYVLKFFGLRRDDLPTAKNLTNGYFIASAGRTLLCYVVTVDGASPAQLLESNFEKCLRDSALQSLRTLWVPLMGTGAGRLSLADSFRITLNVLVRNEWNSRPNTSIIISTPGPEKDGFEALAAAVKELVPSSSLPEEVADEADRWEPSLAAEAVLSVARALSASWDAPALTTELLLFALAAAAQTDVFARLGQDRSAAAFGIAVHELAGDRYDAAWKRLFGRDSNILKKVEGGQFARTTTRASAILDGAATRAKSSGRKQFTVDDLVRTLLDSDGIYAEYLDDMGIQPPALLEAYEDVLTGQVLMNLHNDAASTLDYLGYKTYAQAIAAFVANPSTPAPLSISVQAPWGAGKSSLMQMIRERLDPERNRNAHRPKIGQAAVGALSLGSVLNFLDRKEDIGPDFWNNASASSVLQQPDSTVALPHREGLITIWFNAWKYESSEQVWSGLVDAIVSQIGDRLPVAQREAFLLRLHLARIDDGIVRRRIYDRVLTIWWAQVRRVVLFGMGTILSLFGLGAAKVVFPDLGQLITNVSQMGYWGGIIGPVLLAAYLVMRYRDTLDNIHSEPAEFSMAPYLTVPDYAHSVGAIHQIHADLRRVLAAGPKESSGSFAPIVIFIDDLDRCSPTKIASVVEGISMLLASDTYRCMFVIGMDPQMIAAALEKAHEDIREKLPSFERGVPLGWRFMDKFVQLPFTIPPQVNLRDYWNSLGGAASAAPAAAPSATEPVTRRAQGTGEGDPAKEVSDTAAQVPDQQRTADAAVSSASETRDVGRIIRQLEHYSIGNPREIKRMVNLARLYLALRNERRRLNPLWYAPSLDQYARWIALTLRWPDMMRWLQWGADQKIWSVEDNNSGLIARRLRVLEVAASETTEVTDWASRIEQELYLDKNDAVEWRKDPKLFEFFQHFSQSPSRRRLSAAAEVGFW